MLGEVRDDLKDPKGIRDIEEGYIPTISFRFLTGNDAVYIDFK